MQQPDNHVDSPPSRHASPVASPTEIQRAPAHWTRRENMLRMIWLVVESTVFKYSFHNFYEFRSRILRLFGAKIPPGVRIRRTARFVAPWNLEMGTNSSIGDHATLICVGKIKIGDHVSISQLCYIVAGSHDYTKTAMPAVAMPITIEDHTWVAADVFICGGVTVGEGCVIGARAVVSRSTEPWGIYVGNPARRKGDRRLEGVHEPSPAS
ncbi:MAG: putative colanic acid biosynthesis acetyltransferase [Phycisphaerales bacterium]|nr:MAG: putative colanic acid biosynthesis acetyltransferase [Phycisphaerales bacterium]